MVDSIFEEAKIKTIKELKNDFKANYQFKRLYNNLLQFNISETNFDDLFNYLDTQAKDKFKNYFISSPTLEDIFLILNGKISNIQNEN